MDGKIRDLLRCPACDGPVRTDRDVIRCEACGKAFPVVRDIPRFVSSEQYAGSFGLEWNAFDVAIPAEDDAVYRVKTGWTPEMLSGRRVLDAGCGGGRYSAVAARWGAAVVSLDMSMAVEKARAVAPAGSVTVIQGDLLNPPLKPGTFDFVFSIGVLHHTPDTRRAFQAIARLVRPGGQLAVWVYRRNTWPQEALNSGLRAVSTRLPAPLLMRLCHLPAVLSGIPVLNKGLGRVVNLGTTHPAYRIRLCDAFDWYSPKYQHHHTLSELGGWFVEAGFPHPRMLLPQKQGRLYSWMYRHNLIIGSGVNMVATKE